MLTRPCKSACQASFKAMPDMKLNKVLINFSILVFKISERMTQKSEKLQDTTHKIIYHK